MAKRNSGNAEQDEANDVLDSLGIGDDSTSDDSNDDSDTGPVEDADGQNQDLNEPEDTDTGEEHDEDEEHDDSDPPPDEDALAAAAREAAGRSREREPKPKPGQQQSKAGNPFDPRAKLQTDKTGNIYLNGQKIANAGREARMYMGFRKVAAAEQAAAQKMAGHVANVAAAAKEIMVRYDALQKTKTALDTAGLSQDEQQQTIALATAYKKSPIEAIKLMLTRAHMAGVDIKSITGANGGIDTKTLMDEMSGRMTELLKPVLTQTSEAERTRKLAQQAEGFFQRNPTAKQVAALVGGSHKLGIILKEAMRRAPNISMDEHYQKLHYAILLETGGKLPPTGPVANGRPTRERQVDRRLSRNFKRSVRKPGGMESLEDIAASVLADANALTARGV